MLCGGRGVGARTGPGRVWTARGCRRHLRAPGPGLWLEDSVGASVCTHVACAGRAREEVCAGGGVRVRVGRSVRGVGGARALGPGLVGGQRRVQHSLGRTGGAVSPGKLWV